MFRYAAPFFGRFGDRWSDETLARIVSQIEPCLGARRELLDLGGGTGALAARLADALDVSATVLDPSPEMIAQMKPNARVSAVVGSAEAMPFPADAFDSCVVSDAFHHFRDQDGAVREMSRVVRPGGCVLILDFDRRGLMRLIVWAERLLGEPASFFTPDELCAFMAARGIEGHCQRTDGANYYFLGTVT